MLLLRQFIQKTLDRMTNQEPVYFVEAPEEPQKFEKQ